MYEVIEKYPSRVQINSCHKCGPVEIPVNKDDFPTSEKCPSCGKVLWELAARINRCQNGGYMSKEKCRTTASHYRALIRGAGLIPAPAMKKPKAPESIPGLSVSVTPPPSFDDVPEKDRAVKLEKWGESLLSESKHMIGYQAGKHYY